ncbi:MAG: hypothetical protein OXP07_15020 [Defluviicoccus sp.]|nr:hypothetical protein [Defluviicoccus sp.]
MAAAFHPPAEIGREEIVRASEGVLARPDISFSETETILRIDAAGMEWDIGVMLYEPDREADVPIGPDGRKIGVFLTHGGASDWRSMEPLARLLAGKLGYRIASMTYPGRLYLPDPSRDWPGDTIRGDGTVRTPIWLDGERIGDDEYEVVHDASMRARHGIRPNARARPGTRFHDRMASWPLAFEDAMKAVCRRYFPPEEYSIYVHGHSTGGPFVNMLSQRVDNVAGLIGVENSPFGYIYRRMAGREWTGPFTDLLIRNWREIARYRGAEALKSEGPEALMSLAALMEDVLDEWSDSTRFPQFKAEYIVHYACTPALEAAAEATAARLRLCPAAARELTQRYVGMGRELSGPGARPVPPLLFGITAYSRDHTAEKYRDIVVPAYRAMNPAPKIAVVQFGAGIHSYWAPEEDLPMGTLPAVIRLWEDAISGGYFLV